MAAFVVLSPEAARHGRLPIRVGAVIGRGPGCDIRLYEQLVSRRHARVGLDDHGWYIEDLDSMNGVEVRGRLDSNVLHPFQAAGTLRRGRLYDGVLVRIGPIWLKFFDGPPEPSRQRKAFPS